ncbi:PREDICTED: uncharacterized protein LOC109224954 [Nicotiana attenuata]|uniref:Apple domain-containing protein n=1 Tax=Nicotiana attenuata TaxID=49451 RepID=A0A1J6IGX6_NICAT|nr:PREDICTED: uncharacterized protein LOC109224954 [Nicotiana attenuata]OIT04134.1 hypothetical protein A4A49_11026 [Nicotiana attenuata]
MARTAAEWRGKWCLYKQTMIVVCSINIFVALYVLHSLYTSVYMYPFNHTQTAFRYTSDQIRKMEESIQLRKQLEPIELINVVNGLKIELLKDEKVQQIPQHIKQKIADDILVTLKGVNANADETMLQDVVESWRREKLKEAAEIVHEKTSNSTISPEEASLLARALKDDWAELSEEIGLWIPVQITNIEHDDKPEGEEELDDEVIAGKQLPPECHAEIHTDYGGAAVRWGLTHHKKSAYECCMACLNQAKHAKPNQKKCNIWVYCPSETGCHSPDIYQHKHQECWLKYAETPTLNFKDRYPESYRNAHPNAPVIVPWMSGVVGV